MSRLELNNLSAAKQARLGRWLETRKGGRRSFIIKYGVLGWGIGVTAGVTFMDWYHGELGADALPLTALRLVIFMTGGLAWGAVMWWWMERFTRRVTEGNG